MFITIHLNGKKIAMTKNFDEAVKLAQMLREAARPWGPLTYIMVTDHRFNNTYHY